MPAQNTLQNANAQDHVELKNLAIVDPLERTLAKESTYTEEVVETSSGKVTVAHRGDNKKIVLLTYHDLGLNYISNFQAFFNYPEMRELVDNFSVYHINAPGQQEEAGSLGEDFEYPSMEQLAEQVQQVLNHFNIVKYIGVGVGLGANVLIRHALAYPERVDCMMLINASTTKSGWMEWGYQKRNVSHLRTSGVTQAVLDYLLWHHLGRDYAERAHDLINVYTHYFNGHLQPTNLAKLVEQYIWRSDIVLDRMGATLEMPVLNLVGIHSPHIEDTVTTNGKLAPTKTNWMKVQDAAMILEEQPGKVVEALRLFLQGQGYCLKIRKVSL
jgi:pimeloyl-ACP methyl ester carboxylesterase